MRRSLFGALALALLLSAAFRGFVGSDAQTIATPTVTLVYGGAFGANDARTSANPTVTALETRVAEQAATIEALETAVARATTVVIEKPPGTDASALGLGPPIMSGGLGDVWELDANDDSFWWSVVNFGWTDSPSPRYVAEPNGYWFVVAIDIGIEDSWRFSDFPYGAFALEDDAGNIYFPDFNATNAFCDEYCDMDIMQQDFSGWVGHTFHQAIVFDVPALGDDFSDDDPGLTLRTLDGLIAVPLRR